MQKISILTFVNNIEQQLLPVYHDMTTATQYAWWTLEFILNKSQAQLIAQEAVEITPAQQTTIKHWIEQLVDHNEPIQYLIGSVPFGPLNINVEHPILIPRPETEEWTLNLIKQLKEAGLQNERLAILDVATGSGCIALALAHALQNAMVFGTDVNPDAIKLAQKNGERNKIQNVRFFESDLFASIPRDVKFDLIVANPPYISFNEFIELDPSVTAWEDINALVADDEGFAIIAAIIEQAKNWLRPNTKLLQANIPQLAIEIGHQQGHMAQECMKSHGYKNVAIVKDLAGKDRLIIGNI